MRKQRGSESGKEAAVGRGMDGPETSETKVEDKGEPEEAAAEIEAGGRRKEIADDNKVSTGKVETFFVFRIDSCLFYCLCYSNDSHGTGNCYRDQKV